MLKMLLDANGGALRLYFDSNLFSYNLLFAHATRILAGIVLTNDGNAILREIDVSHPAAKVFTA